MALIASKYKDSLFRALFGSPERKDLALELYNALNYTNYSDPENIEIFTLDDVVFLGMRNDVAFILADDLTLIEHQSTLTQNIALRAFLYGAHEVEKYLEAIGKRNMVYYSTPIIIPTPKLIVLYNGTEETEDKVLRLSNSFKHPDRGDIEATVHLYNINAGRDLPSRCTSLNDYATFVDIFRKAVKHLHPLEAADRAINALPNGRVKTFLLTQKAGVIDMWLTEYDEEATRQAFADAAKEEGIQEGIKEGAAAERIRMAKQLLASGKMSAEDIQAVFGVDAKALSS